MNAMPPTLSRSPDVPLLDAPLLDAPLLDALGARWRVGVRAESAAWDAAGTYAGFALGDGSLALAPATWDGGPALRARQGGGAELIPATTAAPPVARVPVHRNRCLSVAADPAGGFLTGGADGRIARVQTNGAFEVIAHLDSAATHLTAGAGGWRVVANGQTIQRLGGEAAKIDLPAPVASLALEPSGARLAIGHATGVALWAGGAAPRMLPDAAGSTAVAWSRSGTWLTSLTTNGTLQTWRATDLTQASAASPENVAVLAPMDGGFAVGIAGRVLFWRAGQAQVACGVTNQSSVTRICCHPAKPVIAAGYANGAVVLCQPASTGLVFIRGPGEGSVTALAFSAAGDRLAIGTAEGEIAILMLPDIFFRDSGRSP